MGVMDISKSDECGAEFAAGGNIAGRMFAFRRKADCLLLFVTTSWVSTRAGIIVDKLF